MESYYIGGGRALIIAVGITMLVFFILTGSVSSMPDSSGRIEQHYSNAGIYRADRALADYQTQVFSPFSTETARTEGLPHIPHENGLLDKFHISGMLEAKGTHFEIKNSSYLNITLDSSEPVNLTLESAPEMVTMRIESASGAASAQISIGGFAPLTTYHKYEDDYHNHTAFTTDADGKYTYTQDLSRKHLIFTQPRPSTRFINDNATGGDCTPIGTWNAATKTCTLTTDSGETIQIDSDGITLNGNGHTITGSNTGSGVYLSSRTGITIKNLNVKQFDYGIYLYSSSSNMLSDNNASNNGERGIYLDSSNNNTLSGNKANSNIGYGEAYGISLSYSSNNTLIGNNASSNDGRHGGYGISLSDSSNNTLIDNNANENHIFGISLSSSSNNTLIGNNANKNRGEQCLCNGNLGPGIGISLSSSSNNSLIDNNASSNYGLNYGYFQVNGIGISLFSSNNNMLSSNNASNNDGYGILLEYSSNNTLINNIMTGNKYNFGLVGGSYSDFNNQIDTSNLVDGKPVYYIIAASNRVYDSSTSAGIFYCINCINVTIKDLDFNNNSNGIFFWNTSGSIIQNVNVSNNEYSGISLGSSSNSNTLSGNNASNNGYYGISLDSSNDNMLSGNNASNNQYSISLYSSNNNKMIGNDASNNGNYGISLDSSNDNMLSGNNASNNGNYGISLDSSSNNTISGNALNNGNNGISLGSSNDNKLSGNNASNNQFGIYLDSSNNNTLSGNNASNNQFGISLYSSNNNTLSGNNASKNEYYGISLGGSGNTIYNNYFNNKINAFCDQINIWNITKTSGTNIINGAFLGGNFWSDYAGNDTDGDGLGDTMLPYNSSGGITNGGDYLPLTSSPTHFSVYINISGIPVIGRATGKILKVEYTNFNSGDPYNISITAPNGTRVYYDNGTLIGTNLEIIPIKWTPSTKGNHTIEAWGRDTIESTPVFIFDSEVVSPVPELGTLLLVAIGMLGLIGIRRRY